MTVFTGIDERCRLLAITVLLGAAVGCASVETPQTADAQASATDAASAGATDAAAVAAAGEEDPNEMICSRVRETGSHFSRRVCRTRAQIAAEQEAAQELMRRRVGSGMDPSQGGVGSGG